MRRFITTAAANLLVAAIGVGTVSAADPPQAPPPTTIAGTVVLADCGSFAVLDDFEFTITERVFLDQHDQIVRILINAQGTDEIYNSVTGERYTSTSGAAIHIDPSAGDQTVTGVVYRITVPGAGAVLLDIGRSTLDLTTGTHTFVAGPHQLLDGDVAALCAALG